MQNLKFTLTPCSHNVKHSLSSQLFFLISQQSNDNVLRVGKIAVSLEDLLHHQPAPLTQVMAHGDHIVEVLSSHLDVRLTLDPYNAYIQKTFTVLVIAIPKPVREIKPQNKHHQTNVLQCGPTLPSIAGQDSNPSCEPTAMAAGTNNLTGQVLRYNS